MTDNLIATANPQEAPGAAQAPATPEPQPTPTPEPGPGQPTPIPTEVQVPAGLSDEHKELLQQLKQTKQELGNLRQARKQEQERLERLRQAPPTTRPRQAADLDEGAADFEEPETLSPSVLRQLQAYDSRISELTSVVSALKEADALSEEAELRDSARGAVQQVLAGGLERDFPDYPEDSARFIAASAWSHAERQMKLLTGPQGDWSDLDPDQAAELVAKSLDYTRRAIGGVRGRQAGATAQAAAAAPIPSSGSAAEPQPEELLLRGPGWRQKMLEAVRKRFSSVS